MGMKRSLTRPINSLSPGAYDILRLNASIAHGYGITTHSSNDAVEVSTLNPPNRRRLMQITGPLA